MNNCKFIISYTVMKGITFIIRNIEKIIKAA